MRITNFVICTVKRVVRDKGYMFAVNGDNGDIMCHARQGASHLTVTPEGECFSNGWISILPDEDEKIALIRDSNDPTSGRAYTHAKLWVNYRVFEGARFAADRMDPIHTTVVRAIALNHQIGATFTGSPSQILFEGTVDDLRGLHEDDLKTMRSIHATSLRGQNGKTITASHNTKWEVRRDGKWETCGSIVAQTGLVDEQAIKKLLPK